MNQTASWAMLLGIGILMVIVGFSGSMGKVFAVAFCPAILDYKA